MNWKRELLVGLVIAFGGAASAVSLLHGVAWFEDASFEVGMHQATRREPQERNCRCRCDDQIGYYGIGH